LTDLIPTKRIGCVDSDADNVAGSDRLHVKGFHCFIDDDRSPEVARCGSGEHVLPARRDDGRAERHVAWIDKVYPHSQAS
jgi:hypothetical protein